jgi:WD40 repeat protein
MILRILSAAAVSLLLTPGLLAQSAAKPRLDTLGDPLPDGAVARLGTLRFKHGPFGCEPVYSGACVDHVVFSPDGKKIASLDAQLSGTLRLWDRASGKQLPGPWTASDLRHAAVVFSADGETLAAVSMPVLRGGLRAFQDTVIFYDVKRAATVRKLSGIRHPVRALAFADAGKTLVLAGNGYISWWDLTTDKEKRFWKPFAEEKREAMGVTQTKAFDEAAFSPEAKSIAVHVNWITDQARVRVPQRFEATEQEACGFNLLSGKLIWCTTAKYGGDQRSQFAHSADGKRVAIALGPDRIEVRDTGHGKLVTNPINRSHTRCTWVGGVALSSDGQKMAMAGDNAKLCLWNTADTGTLQMVFARAWPYSGHCVQFTPDDKQLLMGVHVDLQHYDVVNLQEITPWPGHRRAIDMLTFTLDGKTILSGSTTTDDLQPREVMVWDTTTWKERGRASAHLPRWPNQGHVAPDLSVYVGKESTDRLALYSWRGGNLLGRLQAPTRDPRANLPGDGRGFFSPGGKHYVLYRPDLGDKGLALYALPSGKLRSLLPAIPFRFLPDDAAQPIAFSADERLVALFAKEDGKICICETATGKERQRLGEGWSNADALRRRLRDQSYFSGNLAFSPDTKLLASWIMEEKVIRVWDVATGTERQAIPLGDEEASRKGRLFPRPYFAWSPDNRILAVGQNKIQLWEVVSNGVRREWAAHEGAPLRALAYAPHGKLMASGSTDTTVLIWDMDLLAGAGSTPVARSGGDLARPWQKLAEQDAMRGFEAIRSLVAAPEESLPWLKDHMEPASRIEDKQIASLIAQLDDGRFRVREKANTELAQLADRALPALNKALAGNPSLETRRRLEGLRKRAGLHLLSGKSLQAYRAVEVLERIGTPAACQLLQALANGAPGALVTTEAHEALVRLREQR